MLVLSRKAGESVLLHLRDGSTVDVKVTEIVTGANARVKLGISAPDDVLILREEIPVDDLNALRVIPLENTP